MICSSLLPPFLGLKYFLPTKLMLNDKTNLLHHVKHFNMDARETIWCAKWCVHVTLINELVSLIVDCMYHLPYEMRHQCDINMWFGMTNMTQDVTFFGIFIKSFHQTMSQLKSLIILIIVLRSSLEVEMSLSQLARTMSSPFCNQIWIFIVHNLD